MENPNDGRIDAVETQMREMMGVMQTLMAQNQALLQRVDAAPVGVPPPVIPPVNGAHNGGIVEEEGAQRNAGNGEANGANGVGVVGENDVPNRVAEESIRRDRTRATGGGVGAHVEASRTEATSVRDATVNPWEEQMRAMQAQMQAQMDGVMAAVRGPNMVDDMIGTAESPFAPAVMACPLPSKFKMPTLDSFDGSRDPFDHLETYKTLMHIHAYPDEIMCRVFPATLKGPARMWFNRLKSRTISSFAQLSKLFVGHFIGGQRQRRPATHLLTIKQGKEESLRDYVGRYNKEILEVDEADDKVVVTAFISGLRTPRFMASLVKRPPVDMAELMFRAQKYINVEDAMKARKENEGAGSSKVEKKRPSEQANARDDRTSKSRRFDNRNDRYPKRYADTNQMFTPLNTRLENVFYEIQNDPALKWPKKLKTPADKRSRTRYCRFHRDHGQDTDDCFDLKREVEELIRRGRLNRFVAGRDNNRRGERRSPKEEARGEEAPIGELPTELNPIISQLAK